VADRVYKQDPKTGRFGLASAGPDVSDEEMASRRATARLGSTAGADLGGKAKAASAAGKPKEETDESKMSPIHRASAQAKRKRMSSATTDDAAGALSRRMAGGY
jgi:hypothetical protein